MEKEGGQQQETKEEDPKSKEPSPQPNLGPYYESIEGGMVIPKKISIPLFFELEKERDKSY